MRVDPQSRQERDAFQRSLRDNLQPARVSPEQSAAMDRRAKVLQAVMSGGCLACCGTFQLLDQTGERLGCPRLLRRGKTTEESHRKAARCGIPALWEKAVAGEPVEPDEIALARPDFGGIL